MPRRSWWFAGALLAGLLGPLPLVGAEPVARPVAVIDLHVDLPYQSVYRKRPFDRGSGQFVATDLKRAGIVGVVLPLYIPRGVSPGGPRLSDLEESYRRVVGGLIHTEPYRLPGCAKPTGGVRTWLALEGSGPLAHAPTTAAQWVARGVRSFGLVHSYDNEVATSAGTGPALRRPASGLTAKGRELVARIHELGAMVDVSHASDRTTAEIVQLAAAARMPAIASHSNARAVHHHARNLTDHQLRAIAATGGVVGVNFHSAYLVAGRRARLSDVVRHIIHMVRLVGPEHVAIGSDFEGGIRAPPALEHVTGLQRLAQALLQAGLSRQTVRRIFSGNALRLLCGNAGASSPPSSAIGLRFLRYARPAPSGTTASGSISWSGSRHD